MFRADLVWREVDTGIKPGRTHRAPFIFSP